jgi:hypothetical protein
MEEKKISPELADRKLDHIELAFKADMANQGPDDRFYYEPYARRGIHSRSLLRFLFLEKR